MHWEVGVTGPASVLDQLAEVLTGHDPSLVREADRFVLRASAFQALSEAGDVRATARQIVTALSAIARLQLQSQASLDLGNVTRVRDDGKRDYFIQPEAGQLRITGGLASLIVRRADGTVEQLTPGGPVPEWFSLAVTDSERMRALRLRDADALSWTDLYRLFEVISVAVGGESRLTVKGWASGNAIKRFRRSANSVAVAGDQARHGVEPTTPPAHPMTLNEARGFVDGLLRDWLKGNSS